MITIATTPIPWVVLQLSNLYPYVEASLLDVANQQDIDGVTAPGGQGQYTRFYQAAADVSNEIRNRIGGVPGYVVSATAQTFNVMLGGQPVAIVVNSIPPELVSYAALLVLERIQGAFPGLSLSDDQKTQISAAKKYINAIQPNEKGECNYRPTLPPDPMSASVQLKPPVAVVRHTPRAITARSMAGISLGVGTGDHDRVPGLM